MKPSNILPSRVNLLACLIAIGVGSSLIAQDHVGDWTQFRGTTGTGTANASAKPATTWTDEQLVWSTDIPGTGWSSPVYHGDHMWMTSAITKPMSEEEIAKKLAGDRLAQIKTIANTVTMYAICVNVNNGEIIHDIELSTTSEAEPINPLNSYASPTPAIADGKVVCHFGSYGTWCLNAKSGERVWNRRYAIKHSVGPGSSPVITNDKVILVCDGTDLQYIVALDLASGAEVWKTDRPPIRATDGEYRKAYCTPLVIDIDGKKQAVIPGAQWIVAYEPETGNEIWRADHGDGFSLTPMPVYESGLIVFSTGYMKGEFVAVDPTGKGDVTKTHLKWRARNAPKMPSFLAHEGLIYSVSDKGIMVCLQAKTGMEVNKGRVKGNYCSSPILAGGHLYLGNRDGTMTIMKCSAEFEVIGTQSFDSAIMATPVLVGNDLVVRTEKKLVRIKGLSQSP